MTTPKIRKTCDACDTKIYKSQPLLFCCICEKLAHIKCEGLKKSEALELIELGVLWSCKDCNSTVFPHDLGLFLENKTKTTTKQKLIKNKGPTKFKSKCACCGGYSYKESNVKTCCYCNGNVHKKCWRGDLGCQKCCLEMIPGYSCESILELQGIEYYNNNRLYNPFASTHFTQQIGETLDNSGNDVWNDLSDLLTKCKYKQLRNIEGSKNSELQIFSLNIAGLKNKIEILRENINYLKNFDILCFN